MEGKLVKALVKAQASFKEVKRSKSGYNYKYAEMIEVINSTKKALIDNGLVIVQLPINRDAQIGVKTFLMHESGESIEGEFTTPTKANITPQEVGSLITYYRRYAYMAILGVAPEDDDGSSVSQDTNQSPGEYMITFGKYKGMKINEVQEDGIKGYMKFMVDSADGKPITGKAKELLDNVDKFYGEI